ncbi:hypothetical protein LIER_41459 [Lithospermum erythrorhizon]|uniref:SWIM-type domain-containing protein n=1 Tax=Lithospermum erythrorhizon TaxID=34254 RepID=A0AAV3RDP3_LITER
MKGMMWKCARVANVPYFEYRMQQIKNMSVEAYETLNRIDPRKWTRCAFHPGTNCSELVNNWVKAFNVVILKARDQPIITMLNTIYDTVRTRIEYEVTYAEHSFMADIGTKHCSCGLWQLGDRSCVHAVCVYKSQNKDPRKYVHKDFLMTT